MHAVTETEDQLIAQAEPDVFDPDVPEDVIHGAKAQRSDRDWETKEKIPELS